VRMRMVLLLGTMAILASMVAIALAIFA
jgi:hypothetical protein